MPTDDQILRWQEDSAEYAAHLAKKKNRNKVFPKTSVLDSRKGDRIKSCGMSNK